MYRSRKLIAALLCVTAISLVSEPIQAQSPGAPTTSAPAKPSSNQAAHREAAIDNAFKAGFKRATIGPASVTLLNKGTLQLPEDKIAFIPQPEATAIMESMGNVVGSNLIGLVLGREWMATVSYIKEGYVKDDDAKNWNADDLLQNLTEGNEQANKIRLSRGFAGLHIVGWIEPPAYDGANHRLVWSLKARSDDTPEGSPQTVNYNTYLLGRQGYFSLNMLTNTASIGRDKQTAQALLSGLRFNDGERYEDFNASTDNVASYGLAALVGGAVLKKTGFLAALLVLLAKFWKLGLIGLALVGGSLIKLFKRNDKPTT